MSSVGVRKADLKSHVDSNWLKLKESLLSGTYKPNAVLQVGIPKESGGTRKLGIPTVVDRNTRSAKSLEIENLGTAVYGTVRTVV